MGNKIKQRTMFGRGPRKSKIEEVRDVLTDTILAHVAVSKRTTVMTIFQKAQTLLTAKIMKRFKANFFHIVIFIVLFLLINVKGIEISVNFLVLNES